VTRRESLDRARVSNSPVTNVMDAPPRSTSPWASRATRTAVWGLPAVAALGLGWWQISTRSFSQDEAATLSAGRRPLPALLRMLGRIDAVHGFYYVLIHGVISVFGASETAVRFPSVIATAVTAAVLAVLTAHLAGRRAGIAAGLLYAASPTVTSTAQLARPYALATTMAVICCYFFLRYVESGQRRHAVCYAVALVAAGWINILVLLIVLANGVALLCTPRWRPRWRGFTLAAAVALILVSPLMGLDLFQVSQVGWEAPPPLWQVFVLLALAVVAVIAFIVFKPGHYASGRGSAVSLTVPWLLVPPIMLMLASQVTPMWEVRYVLFCYPAAVLLITVVVSVLTVRLAAVSVMVLLALVLAGQSLLRTAGSSDDLRAVSNLLARQARPGDVVLFQTVGRRLIKDAYPAGFVHLRDVSLNTSPGSRNSLYGWTVTKKVLSQRLTGVQRIWMIRYSTPHPARYYGTLRQPHAFCSFHTWQLPGDTVTLYRRC
jgi:mannosyltransferase